MKTVQCDKIVAYMKAHGSITHREAEDHIGCTRLAARIADLKKKGYAIGSGWVEGKNRHGELVRFKKYYLMEVAGC